MVLLLVTGCLQVAEDARPAGPDGPPAAVGLWGLAWIELEGGELFPTGRAEVVATPGMRFVLDWPLDSPDFDGAFGEVLAFAATEPGVHRFDVHLDGNVDRPPQVRSSVAFAEAAGLAIDTSPWVPGGGIELHDRVILDRDVDLGFLQVVDAEGEALSGDGPMLVKEDVLRIVETSPKVTDGRMPYATVGFLEGRDRFALPDGHPLRGPEIARVELPGDAESDWVVGLAAERLTLTAADGAPVLFDGEVGACLRDGADLYTLGAIDGVSGDDCLEVEVCARAGGEPHDVEVCIGAACSVVAVTGDLQARSVPGHEPCPW